MYINKLTWELSFGQGLTTKSEYSSDFIAAEDSNWRSLQLWIGSLMQLFFLRYRQTSAPTLSVVEAGPFSREVTDARQCKVLPTFRWERRSLPIPYGLTQVWTRRDEYHDFCEWMHSRSSYYALKPSYPSPKKYMLVSNSKREEPLICWSKVEELTTTALFSKFVITWNLQRKRRS